MHVANKAKKKKSEIKFREFITKTSTKSSQDNCSTSNANKGHHKGPILIRYIESNLERAKAKKRRKETLFEKVKI